MDYKIKKGKRPVGIKMAQNTFRDVWANVFVDCQKCDQSFGIESGSYISDEDFIKIANMHGWSVTLKKHVLCPSCIDRQNLT